MKKSIYLFGLLAAAVMMSNGCNKVTPPPVSVNPDLISFTVDGLDVRLDTKASEVTSLNSFYVTPDGFSWTTTASSTDGVHFTTDKYWPATEAESYSAFYAANMPISLDDMSGNPVLFVAGNSTDVVAAYRSSVSYHTENALVFQHIFARLGTITLNTQDGYQLSNVSGTLKSFYPGGTYYFTGNFFGDTEDSQSLGTFSGSTSTQVSLNDVYAVPDEVTIELTYTLTKGDYSKSFTREGKVTLVGGKINNITITAAGGKAQTLSLRSSIYPWSDKNDCEFTYKNYNYIEVTEGDYGSLRVDGLGEDFDVSDLAGNPPVVYYRWQGDSEYSEWSTGTWTKDGNNYTVAFENAHTITFGTADGTFRVGPCGSISPSYGY